MSYVLLKECWGISYDFPLRSTVVNFSPPLSQYTKLNRSCKLALIYYLEATARGQPSPMFRYSIYSTYWHDCAMIKLFVIYELTRMCVGNVRDKWSGIDVEFTSKCDHQRHISMQHVYRLHATAKFCC